MPVINLTDEDDSYTVTDLTRGPYTINGLAGNDSITGSTSDDTLNGDDGNDTLEGGGGDDRLNGGAGDDLIYPVGDFTTPYGTPSSGYAIAHGGAGNDRFIVVPAGTTTGGELYGDEGDDSFDVQSQGRWWISGDAGNDSIHTGGMGSQGTYAVQGGDGNDMLVGVGGTNSYFGGEGNDQLAGSYGDFDLYGGPGGDTLTLGMYTSGLLDGGDGDDRLSGYGQRSLFVMHGGNGNDVLTGDIGNFARGDEQYFGDAGDDTIMSLVLGRADPYGGGNDLVDGGDGNDLLYPGDGADRMIGGAGFDTVSYQYAWTSLVASLANASQNAGAAEDHTYSSIERLSGSRFDDTLVGDAGANDLQGADGNDYIQARGGNDALSGGLGNDGLEGGAGADTLAGDSGFDYARYSYDAGPVTADLATPASNTGAAAGDTFSSIEGLIGTAFNDVLSGNAAVNDLAGADGNDQIDGRSGNDNLQGMNGDDRLNGGAGSDRIVGGAGNDTFVFRRGEAHHDAVVDFNGNGPGSGDSFVFSGYGTSGATFTRLDSTHWSINSADGLAHEVIQLVNGASVHVSDYTFI